ncbi:MAG: sigma-54-dependent Fis family transcriptional regulator [Myxococcaceae bacterium]|nr:sigma-54-dependent Fis family transcriptional regulator [Myxococcaceae bacterium]
MRILVVDDELSMREYLDLLLQQAGYEVQTAASAADASKLLQAGDFDLVISDMKLGAESGLEVLQAARALPSPPEVILITAYGTLASAVEAMRRGAYDYICKPFDNDELKLLVQKALEKHALLNENRALRSTAFPNGNVVWISNSPAMRQVLALVQKVAASSSTVLVTGESGTGKELVARAIHLQSARAGQPFSPVNCAALNEGVLESELFGHVRGAFTGATQDRPGILVSAGRGTVFLDEIGEVPLGIQVKLLRVLQERKVKPVGSSEEKPFEARIVAATNRNLEAEVRAGRFREDLFYRLNVISIELPPLRSRPEDIAPLARHFLERFGKENGRPGLTFAPETLALLERYSFPGNVRQLQNMVERAATLADSDVLGPESLPPSVSGQSAPPPRDEVILPAGFSLEKHLDQLERQYLVEALRSAGGVKTRAAELLGLTFRSFRYRLAKHGID